MKREELIDWLKVCNVRGLGPSKLTKLLNTFGGLVPLINASPESLLQSGVFNQNMIEDFARLKAASTENFSRIISDCEDNGIEIIPLFSEQYPRKLKLLPESPLTLFCQGDIALLNSPNVAIVGSRESNEPANHWAYTTAKELTTEGISIISGGAKGIDYHAHRGALDASGKTICVFGTGLLKDYPPEHKELFEEIRKKGLIISENLPNFTGGRISLLRRNRITSGLANALISVTSSIGHGSSTQLQCAAKQRIPLFVPKKELWFSPREGIEEFMKTNEVNQIDHIDIVIKEVKKHRDLQKKLLI